MQLTLFVTMYPTPVSSRSLWRLWFLTAALLVCLSGAQASPATKDGNALSARVAAVLQEKKVDDRLKNLAEVGANLSLAEIKEALALAETLAELRERAIFHEAIVKRWSLLEPADAWRHVAQLPESRGKLELIRATAVTYTNRDATAAATAVATTLEGRSRIEAVALVAETWARADVPAARSWVRSLPAGPAKEAAFYNIRFVWVHSDPASAADDVKLLPLDDTRRALTMNIAGAWAARDPQKAIVWARSLPDESEQEAAFANLAESWADASPREAAEFAAQLPPQFRQRAALAVIGRWATQFPRQAAEWAIQIPDTGVRTRGLAEVLTIWMAVDPEAARVWAKAVTPAPLRDLALGACVDALLEWAPDVAARQALEIADPESRWQRVESGLARWLEIDAPAARRWLEAAELPAEKKQHWLSAHGHG